MKMKMLVENRRRGSFIECRFVQVRSSLLATHADARERPNMPGSRRTQGVFGVVLGRRPALRLTSRHVRICRTHQFSLHVGLAFDKENVL